MDASGTGSVPWSTRPDAEPGARIGPARPHRITPIAI